MDNMRTMYQYIHFERLNYSGKTSRWCMLNNRTHAILGYIKWSTAWRRYTLYTVADCEFDALCLEDIQEFLRQLMMERINNANKS